MVSRRTFLSSAALAPFAATAADRPAPATGSRPVVVSSANGLKAAELAVQRMRAGADPLEAIIAGVNLVEDDPKDMSVGYGGHSQRGGRGPARLLRDARADRAGGGGRLAGGHQESQQGGQAGDGDHRPHPAGGPGRQALRGDERDAGGEPPHRQGAQGLALLEAESLRQRQVARAGSLEARPRRPGLHQGVRQRSLPRPAEPRDGAPLGGDSRRRPRRLHQHQRALLQDAGAGGRLAAHRRRLLHRQRGGRAPGAPAGARRTSSSPERT